ncbi:MAG: rhodanese-like domain-containing protein, partial [Gammaproteobacteria bacterium]|nr:rhodanese-like domain-containing protein [Gammaproteobacteria bacterium]
MIRRPPGQAWLLTSSPNGWIVREHRSGPARHIKSMSTYIHTCLLFICFSFTLPCQTATAGDKIVSPESISGTTIVDAEGLIEKATQQPQLVLIDSRITADHREGFIEGSISLPDTDTSCESLARIVAALNTPVLFYCNGVKCGRSGRAAMIAVECGYSNIYWYRKGMEEWQEKEFPLIQ